MLHMIHIYKEKKEEEEKIFRTLFKKVKGSCKVYKKYCKFIMRNNREEEIKNTISKAKTTLDKKKMISLEIHIARLEYKYGSLIKEDQFKQKLNTKTMKTFLTKYLEFEIKYGDESKQEHVRDIAKSFVSRK
ncbi:hypothetical protein EDI_054930 [Entamoeba dispar SAW760]|uniref:Uncharacterized protein n=1 Tax=Entamoeba dispar (strain ATCC PRA-260 / SAW760) TaxID=370354 RepID=B0E8U2_ENTDS|nr:uncharacterized protein EDI_054930 [Entamoeba dispar SAW760]EDR29053.1 hypothetical protein EDI_054930 [Entamoeba dispar SAW760]|eukprot:EDR29053.1 hypothetical protein EDI_054930 [Entamoeba dispar SAW760]